MEKAFSLEIRNIIFDLGGVLIDWDPKYVYRQIFKTEEEIDWFLENITTYEWNVEQDAGRTLEAATQLLLNKHPKWEKEIRAYYGRWEEMLGGPIEEMVELLNYLLSLKKYRILALTNWSYETFPVAIDRYGYFLNLFEGILVSGMEKMKKPDREIYELMLSRYDLVAEESVFIDDSAKNIAGAEACGIKGIICSNTDQVKKDLSNLLGIDLA